MVTASQALATASAEEPFDHLVTEVASRKALLVGHELNSAIKSIDTRIELGK